MILGAAVAARAARAADLTFAPTDFLILAGDGRSVVGHGNYRLDFTENGAVLRGVNHYDDGSSDFETDHIWIGAEDSQPTMADFEHLFYRADGSPMLTGRADMRSGIASCIGYNGGETSNTTKLMDFPPDTWAGAGIMIPMQAIGRAGAQSTHQMHVFTCAPTPKIFTIDLSVSTSNIRWPLYKGESAEFEITPNLGIFDVFVRPFVPRLHAWFDPHAEWDFVGAEMTRYYRGPKIIIAKAPSGPNPSSVHDAQPHPTEAPTQAK